jgi:hypothetical protein
MHADAYGYLIVAHDTRCCCRCQFGRSLLHVYPVDLMASTRDLVSVFPRCEAPCANMDVTCWRSLRVWTVLFCCQSVSSRGHANGAFLDWQITGRQRYIFSHVSKICVARRSSERCPASHLAGAIIQREVTDVGSEFRAGVVAEFELTAVQARHARFEELANRKRQRRLGLRHLSLSTC